MSRELKDRAPGILAEALRRPTAERDAFVGEACAGDEELEREVRSLLAAATGAAGFLAEPTLSVPGGEVGEGVGAKVGPYKLLELLGEGGFGRVFMAEQQTPVVRRVALKIIKVGMDTHQVVARFEAERQALALMEHPNIARVLDAGATSAGRPYFVMELVRGVPITRYCDEARLSTEERLGLFVQVCRAVQHAHQKGIIHRDLKPGNVLVTMHDGVPVPKVIDFGIAKATQGRLTEKTLFTEHRALIGTPEYMSPEQAEMSGLDVDTRSDVYSLGVLLYELLTGATPFDAAQLRGAAFAEMQRIIREVDPVRPSTRVSTMVEALPGIAAQRRTEPKKLGMLIKGDLDWVVMKALEKDRRRRYESAAEMGADVERHMAGEPVLAAPPSRAYKARKFARRHRGPVIAGSLVVLALSAGLAGTWVALRRAEGERREAERARVEAEGARAAADTERAKSDAVVRFMQEALQGSNPERGGQKDLKVSEAMEGALKKLDEGAFKDQPRVDISLRSEIAGVLNNVGRSVEALPEAQRVVADARREYSGDDVNLARSIDMLANVLHKLGRDAEAEPLYREALAMRRRLFPGDHKEVAEALDHVARALEAGGHAAQAEPMYREALAMLRRLYAGDHEVVLWGINDLANGLVALGRLDEAEPLYRESLAMARRLHNGDHHDVATALSNLGEILSQRGDSAGAQELYEQELAMDRRLFAGDHPEIATGLNNVAAMMAAQGRSAEASELLREVLAMERRMYPGDHPKVAQDMNNLAVALFQSGRGPEAEALLRDAIAMFQRVYPGDHWRTANALTNLARCLDTLGRTEEALAAARRADEMARRVLTEKHEIRRKCADVLAGLEKKAQGAIPATPEGSAGER
jgi:serine/threonine protein kinase/tetratricopeptide (TPR) repeat protein